MNQWTFLFWTIQIKQFTKTNGFTYNKLLEKVSQLFWPFDYKNYIILMAELQ